MVSNSKKTFDNTNMPIRKTQDVQARNNNCSESQPHSQNSDVHTTHYIKYLKVWISNMKHNFY